MPNVDTAIRLLTYACSDRFNNLNNNEKKKIINSFIALPNNEKPNFFKKLSDEKIILFFTFINEKLRKKFSEHFNGEILEINEASNCNFNGADLVIKIKQKNRQFNQAIELKFGAETLKALGVKSFDSIFKVNNNQYTFKDAFHQIQNKQKAIAEQDPGNIFKLINNLNYSFDNIVKLLNDYVKDKKISIDSDQLRKQLNCSGSASMNEAAVAPAKFIISYKNIDFVETLDWSGDWHIDSIFKSEKDNTARLTFLVSNNKTKVKFLVHWKNDIVYKGVKYPAKVGINSWCFNVWADKENKNNE